MTTAGTSKVQHWRDRLGVDQPLEMWEVLAEEFETGGSHLPPEFDQLADAYDAGGKDPGKRHELEQMLFRIFLTGKADPHKPAPDDFGGRSALCFSGGGVRSATFGLGVLQGLAACMPASPIPKFDFLSTVSGGGYLGSWFSAWASRLEADRKVDGPEAVVDELKKSKTSLDPESEPLLHIRQYCAFLTPKLGLLSADAWTLAATIARNM